MDLFDVVKGLIQDCMKLSLGQGVKLLLVANFKDDTIGYCSEKMIMSKFCKEIFSNLKLDDVLDNSDYADLFEEDTSPIERDNKQQRNPIEPNEKKFSENELSLDSVTNSAMSSNNKRISFTQLNNNISTENELGREVTLSETMQLELKEKEDFLKSIENLNFIQYTIRNKYKKPSEMTISLETLFPKYKEEPLIKKKMQQAKKLYHHIYDSDNISDKKSNDHNRKIKKLVEIVNKKIPDSILPESVIKYANQKFSNAPDTSSNSVSNDQISRRESNADSKIETNEQRISPSRKKIKLDNIKKPRDLKIKIPDKNSSFTDGSYPFITNGVPVVNNITVNNGINTSERTYINNNNLNNIINVSSNGYDKTSLQFSNPNIFTNILDETLKPTDEFVRDFFERNKNDIMQKFNSNKEYMKLISDDNLHTTLNRKHNRVESFDMNEVRPQPTRGTFFQGQMMNFSPTLFSPIAPNFLLRNSNSIDCTPNNASVNHYLTNSGYKMRQVNNVNGPFEELCKEMMVMMNNQYKQQASRKSTYEFVHEDNIKEK